MRRRYIPQIAVLSAILTGCQFLDLSDEIKKMEKFSSINGTVVGDIDHKKPIIVALFSGGISLKQVVNARVTDAQKFRFGAPPGRYFLFAFEDTSGDFRYQRGEPAGVYGGPSAVELRAGVDRNGIEINLRRNFSLLPPARPGAAGSKSGTKAYPNLWAGSKNIGVATSLDDRRFGANFAKMGMWEPLRYSLEVGPGLFLLDPYDPKKIPVLFVHGIGGTPRDWRTVAARLDRRRFQPWFLSYASGLPLEANATYMFNAVTQMRLKHRFEKLFLVAHSMGGLVSQGFIDRYRKARGRYLKLYVTLSTPWGGHRSAQLGVDYAPAVVPVWRDMAPGSAYLTTVSKSRLPPGLPYHLLFSFRGGAFPSAVANDGSVTVASQLDHTAQSRAHRIHGFDVGHVGILSDAKALKLLNRLMDKAHRGELRAGLTSRP